MSNREFVHDIVLQVAAIVAFFAIMGAITSWNCARCDAALKIENGKLKMDNGGGSDILHSQFSILNSDTEAAR